MAEPAWDYTYYSDGEGGSDAPAIRYKAMNHQGRVYLSQKKLIFMGGGVGCGKTDIGSLWTVKKCIQTPPDVVGMICANTYTQLLDSTMWNVYRNFKKWNVDVRPRELPKVSRPFNIHVWNGRHFVEIRCRSLDAYNTLSGQEIGWAWADEVFMTKKEAIDVVMARLRDRRIIDYREGFDTERYGVGCLQMLFTTVLDEPSSWMHEVFVDKFDPKRMLVLYAKTADNRFLDDDYIPGLKALYSPQMFRRMVESQWVTLEGGRIYYNFDRLVHVSKVAEYVPGLKVYWTHDFNIGQEKPMSSCMAQLLKAEGPNGKMRPEIHFFDEIVIESADTNDAVGEFEAREWITVDRYGEDVEIHGDASGRHKDTRSKTTDYKILKDAGFVNQRQPRQNPPLRSRHNSFNAMLLNAEGDVRIKIHPRCRTLIKGLETVHLKKGAQYLEDDSQYEQHVTTAAGYLIHRMFPADRRIGKMVSIKGF